MPTKLSTYKDRILPRYFSNKFIEKIDNLLDLCSYDKIYHEKVTSENEHLSYSIDVLARSFFTSIYYGSIARWLYPKWFFVNHWAFPFLDKEFLKTLLTVPQQYLHNNNLYIELMNSYHKNFMAIPVSSNQIQYNDPRINFCKRGKYWFNTIKVIHNEPLKLYLESPTIWTKDNFSRHYRNKIKFKGWILNTFFPSSKVYSFTDISEKYLDVIRGLHFEAWLRKHYINQ